MSEARVNVFLDQAEWTALVRMAESEYRLPRDQMRFVLHEELKRRGLLPQPNYPQTATEQLEDGTALDPQVDFDHY